MSPPPYHPPVKRSITIQGHKTSISLEPLFWEMLRAAAASDGVSMAALVRQIDAERLRADPAPGLAGAIRIWLVAKQRGSRIAPAAPTDDPGNDQ